MKAIAVIPGEKCSVHLRDIPVPEIDDKILVRSIRAGVCATDREINEGLYGKTPAGIDYLVLGHESCGVIEKIGSNISGFRKGQHVVRAVRRPCNDCTNCKTGSNDLCSSGNFIESGIKELNGCMAEYFKDEPKYLIKIPEELKDISVLLEPLSVIEKAFRRALEFQRNFNWKPKNALVIGAGPIGILQSMLLLERGTNVYVLARSPPGNLKSQIITSIGANYISTSNVPLDNLILETGKLDFIVEASGDSKMAFEAMKLIDNNGILCLTSVTGGNKTVNVPSDKINLDFVLGNKILFGTVNANIVDYHNGVKDLEKFMNLWPTELYSMITRRVKLQDYKSAFESLKDDIKTTIEID